MFDQDIEALSLANDKPDERRARSAPVGSAQVNDEEDKETA